MSIGWKKALDIEKEEARIIHKQVLNGVAFDLEKAEQHIQTIDNMKDALYDEMRPYLSVEVVNPYTVEVKKPWVASGDYSAAVKSWYPEGPPDIVGPFSRIRFEEPDIGSRQKLTKQLLRVGWEPELFTEKGAPKLTDSGDPVPSLMRIKAPVGKQLAKWYVLSHRQSQIAGWIKRVRPDGRITAGANSCGTNTARMRHKNVVNVPKASPDVVFGHEMRDLFIARPGYTMVGHDASGLEARVMAHYTTPIDGGEFAQEILHGDIHSKNAIAFFAKDLKGRVRGDDGFEYYRDMAKTLFYGLIYGAQVGKVKQIVGCSQKQAKKIFEEFWSINPGLGKLRDKVIKIAEKNGWVPGLDGRKIYIRSPHSALNALFQSAGAIIMKVSLVVLDHWIQRSGIESIKCIDQHDEGQSEIPSKDVTTIRKPTKEELLSEIDETVWSPPKEIDGMWESHYCTHGELAVKSIRKAGKILNLRCELDAEYKVGSSWAHIA